MSRTSIRRPAMIYAHPRSMVHLDATYPSDPREQPVAAQPEPDDAESVGRLHFDLTADRGPFRDKQVARVNAVEQLHQLADEFGPELLLSWAKHVARVRGGK
jgi:hypothetical protein